MGRATCVAARAKHREAYFNPRPPCGGRHQFHRVDECGKLISIHALRGEGDYRKHWVAVYMQISIHALRGEGDDKLLQRRSVSLNFNPRPPWGGRRAQDGGLCANNHFNPRPPWGGRPQCLSESRHTGNFNPRPPWGGRREIDRRAEYLPAISIHALRGEGDGCLYVV